MQTIISGQNEHNFKCNQVFSINLTEGNILEYIKNYPIMALLMSRLAVDNWSNLWCYVLTVGPYFY